MLENQVTYLPRERLNNGLSQKEKNNKNETKP